jgi:DNA (cytosine-5)-methyltransferase 1
MLSAADDATPGAERVWRDLRRMGFEVEGGLFEAPEVGGTDERQRLFILGVADAWGLRCGAGDERHLGAEAASWSTFAPAPDFPLADLSRHDRRLHPRSRPERLGATDARGRGASVPPGVGLADPSCDRRGAGRLGAPADDGRRGGARSPEGDQPSPRGRELADAGRAGLSLAEQPGQPGQAERGIGAGSTAPELRGAPVVDAGGRGRDGRPDGQERRSFGGAPVERPGGVPLWPPRPNDATGWAAALDLWPAAQPAVRGMAHGVAGRVDPLRMLGNGVKPLQAAYALRTLATRLSARSAGAALLVRMMDLER